MYLYIAMMFFIGAMCLAMKVAIQGEKDKIKAQRPFDNNKKRLRNLLQKVELVAFILGSSLLIGAGINFFFQKQNILDISLVVLGGLMLASLLYCIFAIFQYRGRK